jgi:O-antigen ligase
LAKFTQTACAVLLISLEFTNLVGFWALGGNVPASTQHSRYLFQFVAYGLAMVVLLLDPNALRRFGRKPVLHWSFCLLVLLTWSMLVRTFSPPASYTYYEFVRYFALRINAIGFLLTCVIIFDDPHVLSLAKRTIVIATIAAVAFDIYDLLHPGLFSDHPGRAAGLYVEANAAGMALVIGGLIGVSTIGRLWVREMFLLCVLAGVVSTVSREAMLTFVIVPVGAALAGVLSLRRLLIAGLAACMALYALNVSHYISASHVLNEEAWSRMSLRWDDQSANGRLFLAEKTLEQFEEAPLIGQGFGTALFWADQQSHNAYLGLMADCGILGCLVLPALMFSIRRAEWRFYAFALIFLLWGFFYHDVLTNDVNFGLIAIAVEADESREDQPLERRI